MFLHFPSGSTAPTPLLIFISNLIPPINLGKFKPPLSKNGQRKEGKQELSRQAHISIIILLLLLACEKVSTKNKPEMLQNATISHILIILSFACSRFNV